MACGHLKAAKARISASEARPSRRLNGSTMNQYRNHHEREAARLRLLLANATTSRVNVWPAPPARVLVNLVDQSTPTYPVSGRTLAKMEIRTSWSS